MNELSMPEPASYKWMQKAWKLNRIDHLIKIIILFGFLYVILRQLLEQKTAPLNCQKILSVIHLQVYYVVFHRSLALRNLVDEYEVSYEYWKYVSAAAPELA